MRGGKAGPKRQRSLDQGFALLVHPNSRFTPYPVGPLKVTQAKEIGLLK